MNESTKRRMKLVHWIIFTTLIWLVVLPWITRWKSVEQHLRLLDERRIDASAMFYTELEDRPIE